LLALLSFTASKLWELRDRRFRQLSRKAYVSLGGVGGALAQHAEATLTALPSEERRLVREVFRHAVTAEGTRAVLTSSELDDVLGGGLHSKGVVEKLVAARLLVISESEGGGERVEIAHEALLEAWPRLVAWRREDAEGARLRDQLRAAARQWEERGRPRGLLWRSDALAEYRLWRARYPGALTAAESAFASASLADAARGRRARTALLIGAFITLAGVVVALSILYARAQRNQAHAEASERAVQVTAKKLQDNLTMQYEELGRRLVIAGDPLQGLAYLAKAASMGAGGPAHELLLAQAVRDSSGALFHVPHDNSVYRVRFSPDGKRFVTSSYDFQARIWDAASGALVATLPHEGPVRIGEYDAAGRLIVTSSQDGTARLWDAADGRALHVFSGHLGRVRAAISPDGTRVVTMATDDETVRIWEAATGKPLQAIRVPGAGQNACAFSADGTLIAAGETTGPIHVWDAATGRSVATLRGHQGGVLTIAFSPDGRRLLSASDDGTAAVWEVRSGRRSLTLTHRDVVNSAVFNHDGSRIATASNDRTAIVWDAAMGRSLHTLVHMETVSVAVFSPDGSRLATGSADASVRLWDPTSGRLMARFVGHEGVVNDVAFDPQGQRLAAASGGSVAIVWRAEPQERVVWLRGHTSIIRMAHFAPDGRRLVTASVDGTARVWEVPSGREVVTLSDPKKIGVARFDASGTRVATGSNGGTVRIWDATTGALQREVRGHDGVIHDVAWSGDGARIASASADGTASIWSAATGERLLTMKSDGGKPFYDAQFIARGSRLVTTSGDNTARVWDVTTGRELLRRSDPQTLRTLDLDPTGQIAVSSTFKQSATMWRVDTGATVAEIVGHSGDVMSSSWSADGRFVATSSSDGKTRIWNAANAQVVGEVVGGGTPMWWTAFSPDGKWIFIAEGPDSAALHELPARRAWTPEELERLLKCRVPYEIQQDRVVSRPRSQVGCDTPSAK
jgi:WD40 repeat protein